MLHLQAEGWSILETPGTECNCLIFTLLKAAKHHEFVAAIDNEAVLVGGDRCADEDIAKQVRAYIMTHGPAPRTWAHHPPPYHVTA